MARRKLSTQGRVAAAGVSVALAGVLAGFMAAGDHTATANAAPQSSSSSSSNDPGALDAPSGSTATPYPGNGGFDDRGSDQYGDGTSFQPQPQTRSGGS